MMFYAETYTRDRELYDDLGLQTFAQGYGLDGSSEWRDIGTVKRDWADVRVEVSCLPAQFYRFTVTSKIEDVQSGVLQTGSGALSDYWPMVEQWISGMWGYSEVNA